MYEGRDAVSDILVKSRDVKGRRCTLHPLHALPLDRNFLVFFVLICLQTLEPNISIFISTDISNVILLAVGFVTFTCQILSHLVVTPDSTALIAALPAVASFFLKLVSPMTPDYPISISIDITLATPAASSGWQLVFVTFTSQSLSQTFHSHRRTPQL